MATATLSYTGPADGQPSLTFTHVGTVPDAMAPSFFLCYRQTYGNYFDNLLLAVTPNAKDGSGAPNQVATDAQIFDAYAMGIANGTAANTTNYLKQQATAAALAQVAAATVTQQS